SFHDQAPTQYYTLSLHDALPIYRNSTSEDISDFNKGNVKARQRMIAQYAVGGMHNLLVVGTDHAAEAITGFFTKYGDGGADLLRSEEHTSELQSREKIVCRLLLG